MARHVGQFGAGGDRLRRRPRDLVGEHFGVDIGIDGGEVEQAGQVDVQVGLDPLAAGAADRDGEAADRRVGDQDVALGDPEPRQRAGDPLADQRRLDPRLIRLAALGREGAAGRVDPVVEAERPAQLP